MDISFDNRIYNLFCLKYDLWTPNTDIYETHDHLTVRMELCGFRPEDIEITFSDNGRILNVKGRRHDTEEEEIMKLHQNDIFFGIFEHDVRLPENIIAEKDTVSAKLTDGMLTVKFKKVRDIKVEVDK